MKKISQGTTIIELLVYSSLLALVLTILYAFYIQASEQRALQITETEIYTNGYRILLDFQQTVKRSTSVDYPPLRESAGSLILNSGEIIYQVNDQGELEKVEPGETNILTDQKVEVESLTFAVLGPSASNPTIKMSFTLKGKHRTGGRERRESFQTAVTLP